MGFPQLADGSRIRRRDSTSGGGFPYLAEGFQNRRTFPYPAEGFHIHRLTHSPTIPPTHPCVDLLRRRFILNSSSRRIDWHGSLSIDLSSCLRVVHTAFRFKSSGWAAANTAAADTTSGIPRQPPSAWPAAVSASLPPPLPRPSLRRCTNAPPHPRFHFITIIVKWFSLEHGEEGTKKSGTQQHVNSDNELFVK